MRVSWPTDSWPTDSWPKVSWPKHAGIRTRIITTVLALTFLALATAGLGLYLQARALTLNRISASLNQAVDLVISISVEYDPVMGTFYDSPETFLQVTLQRMQFSAGESAFGFVDGELWWTAPASVALRPELDAEFVAHTQPLSDLPQTSIGTITTAEHEFRYIVVPVHFANGESGALVQVYDMSIELAPLRAMYLRFALIGLSVLALIGLLIWILVSRLLAPISYLRSTAGAISEADLTQRVPIEGHDELAELSVTVNSMLDRLENAVNSQRELLDDVGHELRTPLTIMRGNLEVMDVADVSDVIATRALVVDEVDRMHRLVEDLLLIAKADQIDFIRPEPVEVATFTDDTFMKAIALGQRNWQLDEIADISAVFDPQRTAQAWLQLAANAVQYSAPGSEIGLGSRVIAAPDMPSGKGLEFWVRDNGIGIAPDDLAIISERHERGRENQRLFADAGEHKGLGLAIVNSIVRAQNGRLLIESEPGKGSTFTVILPIA